MLPPMPLKPRLLAIAATAFAFSACDSSSDKSTLRVSLGSTLQALSVDSVTIDRFELSIVCVDGSRATETGDIGDDGTFEADVPNCPQASVRFRGLTSSARPALHGVVEAVIRPPATELSVPVRRVGTVNFVNDDTYTAVCAVRSPGAPEFETSFSLSPGTSNEQVLPLNGVSLSCAPADTCGNVDTCNFSGPLATTRAVAVTFGGDSTLSLANLANNLVFTVGPPGPHDVGGVFGPFTVSLVDEVGQPINRSDVTVNLVAESPTIHGGFGNGSVGLVNGAAQFNGVTFTTSGTLLMHAEADVDGVLLRTDTRNLQVIAGPMTHLLLTGPPSTGAGIAFDVGIVGADSFGNPTVAPTALVIDSTDVRAVTAAIADFTGTLPFTFYTAGSQTITARSGVSSAIYGVLTVDVVPAAVSRLDLSSASPNYIVGQNIVLRVIARDTWDNIATGYAGTVSLSESPAGDFSYGGAHAFSAGDAGVFDFPAQFASTGLRTVTAGDGSLVSNLVNVDIAAAGTPDHFEVILATLGVQAGESFDVTLRAVDAAGNVATTYEGVVNVFSDGNCSGTFSIDYTMSGVITQQIYCTLVGTWAIKADDGSGHVGQSVAVPVIAGSPYEIGIVQQPPPAVPANTPFSVTVELFDSYGNAADPRGAIGVDVALGDAPGRTLLGTTPVYVGNLITYPNLVIDGSATGATISFTANPPNLEISQDTTAGVFVNALGCPTTFVQAGALDGDPCDFQNPVGSIQTAVNAVNPGGEVHVAGGDYSGEAISITKAVKLLGGYESSFDPLQRNPLLYDTTLKGPTASANLGTIEIGAGGYAVVDGFIIEAADVVDGSSQEWAITVSGSPGSPSAWIQRNRIVGPVASFAIADGGVIDIGDVGQVVIRDNWIHTGGAATGSAAGPRSGIRGGFAPGTVAIVHNSIYVAAAGSTEALFYGGTGTYSLTNNIVVADFATCSSSIGVCAVREGEASFGVASMQNNYIAEKNAVAANIYETRNTSLLQSLNVSGGPQLSGNINEIGAVPDAFFANFAGTDRAPSSMADNDWHLFVPAGFVIGIDATQPFCGPNHQQLCLGSQKDIDGDTHAIPACVGSDEYTSAGDMSG